jgi:hypothetical protein
MAFLRRPLRGLGARVSEDQPGSFAAAWLVGVWPPWISSMAGTHSCRAEGGSFCHRGPSCGRIAKGRSALVGIARHGQSPRRTRTVRALLRSLDEGADRKHRQQITAENGEAVANRQHGASGSKGCELVLCRHHRSSCDCGGRERWPGTSFYAGSIRSVSIQIVCRRGSWRTRAPTSSSAWPISLPCAGGSQHCCFGSTCRRSGQASARSFGRVA